MLDGFAINIAALGGSACPALQPLRAAHPSPNKGYLQNNSVTSYTRAPYVDYCWRSGWAAVVEEEKTGEGAGAAVATEKLWAEGQRWLSDYIRSI